MTARARYGHGARDVRRSLIAAAVAVASTLAPGSALPAAADTSVFESGVTGKHHLVDVATAPGAFCLYDPVDGTLRAVRARPPVAFAVNQTGGPDVQSIAVRARLQRRVRGSDGTWTWKDSALTSREIRDATDASSPFHAWREFSVVGRGQRRVLWNLTWYAPASPTTVTGRSTHRVDTYRRSLGRVVRQGTSMGSDRWDGPLGTWAGSTGCAGGRRIFPRMGITEPRFMHGGHRRHFEAHRCPI
jgi:hypothetical protein